MESARLDRNRFLEIMRAAGNDKFDAKSHIDVIDQEDEHLQEARTTLLIDHGFVAFAEVIAIVVLITDVLS